MLDPVIHTPLMDQMSIQLQFSLGNTVLFCDITKKGYGCNEHETIQHDMHVIYIFFSIFHLFHSVYDS